MATLRILELVHSLGVGGAEQLVKRFVEGLPDIEFVVACLDEIGPIGEELKANRIPVYNLQRRPRVDFRCARHIAQLTREHQIDIVHAHQYTPFSYALLARGIANSPRIVFTEHGRHQPDYRRWKRVLFNRLFKRARDRIVAVGNAVRQALVHNEGFALEDVAVIYNGIPLGTYCDVETYREKTRAELGLGPDDIAVIHVARLDYLKDHRTAVGAFAGLVSERPNARYLIVGDGPLRSDIEKAIAECQVQRYVSLLGTRRDVPRLLAAADIALLSSTSEGIPLCLIEAMAAGLPVVATCVGGVPEMITDGQNGLLVPAKNPPALTSALKRLVDSAQLRRSLGQAGRERAQQQFSEEAMLAAYREVFHDG